MDNQNFDQNISDVFDNIMSDINQPNMTTNINDLKYSIGRDQTLYGQLNNNNIIKRDKERVRLIKKRDIDQKDNKSNEQLERQKKNEQLERQKKNEQLERQKKNEQLERQKNEQLERQKKNEQLERQKKNEQLERQKLNKNVDKQKLNKNVDKQLTQKEMFEISKKSIIGTILYIVLSIPQFNSLFTRIVPSSETQISIYKNILLKALIFSILFVLINKFV